MYAHVYYLSIMFIMNNIILYYLSVYYYVYDDVYYLCYIMLYYVMYFFFFYIVYKFKVFFSFDFLFYNYVYYSKCQCYHMIRNTCLLLLKFCSAVQTTNKQHNFLVLRKKRKWIFFFFRSLFGYLLKFNFFHSSRC